MITVSIELRGDKKVIHDLGELRRLLRGALLMALEKSAKEVKTEARSRVPVRTGKTRKSIKYSTSRDEVKAYVGSEWFVARFLEEGTKKMRPRPWLKPAFENKKDYIHQAIDNAVRKVIGRHK